MSQGRAEGSDPPGLVGPGAQESTPPLASIFLMQGSISSEISRPSEIYDNVCCVKNGIWANLWVFPFFLVAIISTCSQGGDFYFGF